MNMLFAISAEPLERLNNRVSAELLDYGNSRLQEPRAGTWRTYVLTSGAEVTVPPPPRLISRQTITELAELRKLRGSTGKAYRAWVLGADVISVHPVPAGWPIAHRTTGG